MSIKFFQKELNQFEKEEEEEMNYFCWITSKQQSDPSIPDVTRNASWWGENAKSVAGALWEWIDIINSFKR